MSSFLFLKSMLFASILKNTNNMRRPKNKVKNNKSCFKNGVCRKMCRVCNSEKGVIPIFKNNMQPNISNEIENFAGVTICKSDKLPKRLCQKCFDLLKGCIKFREMCQKTNKQLLELSIKKETGLNNYEKNLHEYKETHNNNDVADTHNLMDISFEKLNHNEKNTMEILQESDESYNIHSPTFSEDKSEFWGCTTCNKQFYNMDSYNSHLNECTDNIHNSNTQKGTKEKHKSEFLCDICGKISGSNANLLVHMSIHSNVFPFKCEQCPYLGRTADLLKIHKRSHMVDKPFKCTQCPKTASSSSNLAKHIRHVHSTTRPFKCSYCDKGFSFQYDLKIHVRDIHLRQGTVECDICFKKFNTKKILQGHRVKIHKIKGDRHGRIPSYLQCQLDEQNENGNSEWRRRNGNCGSI